MKQKGKNQGRKITVLYPLPKVPTKKDEKKKLRVAAYCRVSSASDEQLVSYQSQISHYKALIAARPDYELAGIFTDEGKSGTDMKRRDGFNRLLEEAKVGKVDLILTKSLSRFGRNTLDCLKNIRMLKELGVDVFFEKENIHILKSEGEMLLTMISAIAQNESLNQSENVKWGIRRRYEGGHARSVPSGKFLGYKKNKQGNLIIKEAEAVTVRRIYEWFLSGIGPEEIARILTEEGVPMPMVEKDGVKVIYERY